MSVHNFISGKHIPFFTVNSNHSLSYSHITQASFLIETLLIHTQGENEQNEQVYS